ncbi:MAG: AAA family ATPase, partial [Opitutales bacterium]
MSTAYWGSPLIFDFCFIRIDTVIENTYKNEMIFREILSSLEKAARQYKAVALTGPRQSGKTTLAREAFPDLPYVSMENPDTRELARADPRALLRRYAEG